MRRVELGDGADEFVRIGGRGQVHLEAGVMGAYRILGAREFRQGNRRQFLRTQLGANCPDQVIAIASRHAQVGDQNVGVKIA